MRVLCVGASALNSRKFFYINRAFCMQHWDSLCMQLF